MVYSNLLYLAGIENLYLRVMKCVNVLRNNKPEGTFIKQAINIKEECLQWFVMRDLKRSNAKQPAYIMLKNLNIEVFTPMVQKIYNICGKRILREVPYMQDLLFVHARKKELDAVVNEISTLQYRFLRDGKRSPMTVREKDMQSFIQAVNSSATPCYYSPNEITSEMIGKRVKIIGGPLSEFEGCLHKVRGSRIKRLFIELPLLLTASVEVEPEYIQVLK